MVRKNLRNREPEFQIQVVEKDRPDDGNAGCHVSTQAP